ncbi:MAG: hypothetical protein WBF93_10375, partial [Pirellulales bacterium]
MNRIGLLTLHCCLLFTWEWSAKAADGPSSWPQFRGPGSRGVAEGGNQPPDRWSATENVAWKRDIPGPYGQNIQPNSISNPPPEL